MRGYMEDQSRIVNYASDSKDQKIIGELHKASRTHKGQAERLEKILKVIQNADKKKDG